MQCVGWAVCADMLKINYFSDVVSVRYLLLCGVLHAARCTLCSHLNNANAKAVDKRVRYKAFFAAKVLQHIVNKNREQEEAAAS